MDNQDQFVEFESKYMQVEILEVKPKTCVFLIVNGGGVNITELGSVKWYPQWRQYCFFPKGNRVFSNGCMNDINNFIKKLMLNHTTKNNTTKCLECNS
ncbi:MAG TPA: hypothetical protein VLE21_04850 [Candidatus Nitrosocosmicus sp.]|nr:hypothetical protein [Candidatus Nitrosocosmicus sp.]